jgi:hypothetical protein
MSESRAVNIKVGKRDVALLLDLLESRVLYFPCPCPFVETSVRGGTAVGGVSHFLHVL